VAVLLALAHAAPAPAGESKLNVLYVVVDDLRPELGCFGDRHMVTPNIDRLAARGLCLRRAYCQQALCSPSRNSVFSGCRPDTTKVYGGDRMFRQALPDVVALPQHFKSHGYYTRSFGKILHHNGQDDPISWSEPRYWPAGGVYAHPDNLNCRITMDRAENFDNPLIEMAEVPDSAYADGMVADEAIATLRRVKDRPFFLAVGFFKPHTPLCAPKKYWDLYRRDEIELASNPQEPQHVPPIAMSDWKYVRSFRDIPDDGPLSDDLARQVKRAYYACVSYADAQIGRLLDEVDRLGLRERTLVVLWSDNGYQLGEHGMWCKHTNFETSTWVPLVVSVPGQRTAGGSTDALVELVDLYPTLAELCGLPIPGHVEGTSFAPLLDDPQKPWKRAAFSQYLRGGVMGYSMRTDRYRLNRWVRLGDPGEVVALELYDHEADPDENVNVAGDPARAEVVRRLTLELQAGWRGARPVE
jgi:arylsulfatase A-like enzyme